MHYFVDTSKTIEHIVYMMQTNKGDNIMTITQIQNKMIALLTKELKVQADEFDITFMSDGSFNVTLFTEDNQEQDMQTIVKIKSYFVSLGATITNDIDVYICPEDGYIGTFLSILK